MRLLFAEDDRDLARAVKVLLEHAGYSVDAVHDGREALDYARSGGYDGVILDWMMPGMSGIEVLEQLRRGGFSAPCLMAMRACGISAASAILCRALKQPAAVSLAAFSATLSSCSRAAAFARSLAVRIML